MKFLSDEWMKKYEDLLRKEFSKDGKVNAKLVEIYRNCPDGKTRWISYGLKDGRFEDMRNDVGDKVPEATFILSGKYEDYVKVEKGEINQKTALMNGTFALIGNMIKAVSMIGIYDRVTKCKRFDGIEY